MHSRSTSGGGAPWRPHLRLRNDGIGALCMGAGLLFGNVPVIKQNFSLVTIGIVAVSVLPMVYELIAGRRRH